MSISVVVADDEKWVRTAIVNTIPFEALGLELVAKHVHFNTAYFSEYFKKEIGMSFIDYKTSVRIDNANKLLDSTGLTINEVSSKVGFADSKYYSKLFKKVTGMTIQEYRAKSKAHNLLQFSVERQIDI